MWTGEIAKEGNVLTTRKKWEAQDGIGVKRTQRETGEGRKR